MGRRLVAVASVVLAIAGFPSAWADEEGPVRVPGPVPDFVGRLGPLEGATALAVGTGGVAAAAFAPSQPRGNSRLALAGPSESDDESLELPGTARALLFSTDAGTLWVLIHREARRGPGDVSLISIEMDSLKASRRTQMPTTATDLALLPDGRTLLVSCQDELRTFQLPAVSSGLMYVIPGKNTAVSAVPGGDRVLLGRPDGLILVGLHDAQQREGMPVREHLETPDAVTHLAVAPDGSEGMALLADGRVLSIRFDPLRASPDGEAAAIAWRGRPTPEVRSAESAPPAPEPEPTAGVVAIAAPSPNAEPSGPPAPGPSPEAIVGAPAQPSTDGRAALHGRLVGQAWSKVTAVVIYGPDNILRESARVTPDPSGTWHASGLTPGSYRVVPYGGGAIQLVSEPPFQVLEAVGGEDRTVPPFEVIRAF